MLAFKRDGVNKIHFAIRHRGNEKHFTAKDREYNCTEYVRDYFRNTLHLPHLPTPSNDMENYIKWC